MHENIDHVYVNILLKDRFVTTEKSGLTLLAYDVLAVLALCVCVCVCVCARVRAYAF